MYYHVCHLAWCNLQLICFIIRALCVPIIWLLKIDVLIMATRMGMHGSIFRCLIHHSLCFVICLYICKDFLHIYSPSWISYWRMHGFLIVMFGWIIFKKDIRICNAFLWGLSFHCQKFSKLYPVYINLCEWIRLGRQLCQGFFIIF